MATPRVRHVSEHEGFRAATARLQALIDRRAALEAERAQLLADVQAAQAPDPASAIAAVLAGEAPPTRAAMSRATVERIRAINSALEVLSHRAEDDLRQQVERERERARVAVLDEQRAHLSELRRAFKHGLRMAANAARAEDALHARLVDAGFGAHETKALDVPGIDRQALLALLDEREVEAAT